MVHFTSIDVIRAQNQVIDNLIVNIDEDYKQIAVLKRLKKNLELELATSGSPHHLAFGMSSQVVFALFGIVIPLMIARWPTIVIGGNDPDTTVLLWFGAGLATVFVYIFSEAFTAKKDRDRKPKQ